jgi:hypothetical protein
MIVDPDSRLWSLATRWIPGIWNPDRQGSIKVNPSKGRGIMYPGFFGHQVGPQSWYNAGN